MTNLTLTPIPLDQCSLVKVAELLSDKWTLLILRHVFYGNNRFDQFVDDLAISRSVLTDRLSKLVDNGVLIKKPHKAEGQRTRHVYHLSHKGVALFPAIIALMQWGDEHLSEFSEPPLQLIHRECGKPIKVNLTYGDDHIVTDYRQIEAKVSDSSE